MDISGLGASKLLEALEKLGVSKGAELRSLGPQGEPPAELVRAFEDALRAPDGQGGPSVQGVAEGSREHGPFEEAGQDIRKWRVRMRQSLRTLPKIPCMASPRGAGLTASAVRCG